MKSIVLNGIRFVRQNDGHGCGFCACASVYRYYGLNTRRLRLRERLGTDNQSLPFCIPFRDRVDALMGRLGLDTRGTLCPDVFAALFGDGFNTNYVAGDYSTYRKAMRRHLRASHPALALVDGMAHWIVVAGIDDGGVLVLDSSGYCDPSGKNRLRYRLTHEEFSRKCCGVVYVRLRRRTREMNGIDFAREYARGADFYLKCLGRAVPQWLGKMLSG